MITVMNVMAEMGLVAARDYNFCGSCNGRWIRVREVTSNPGAIVFATLLTLIGLIQGLVVGLTAILGARIADRIWQRIGPQRLSLN